MRLKIMAFVAVAAAFIGLSGCETMSAEQCAAADWRGLGFSDAAQNGSDRLSQRAQSCAEKGLTADSNAYMEGFHQGMYEFCRPERGFQYARNGGSFNGACPAELEQPFRAALFDGQRVHQAQSDVDSARSHISSLESDIREIDDNIGSHERRLAEAQNDTDRATERNAIERLRRERRDKNDDIRTAQHSIPQLERVVSDLHYEIGNKWGAW